MSEEKTSSAKTGIKERALQIASATADKADALYNKLPLDKINEKLKGKVDVKSRKFKIGISCVAIFIVLLCLSQLFSGGKNVDDTAYINYDFPVDYFDYVEIGDSRDGKSIRIIDFNEDEDVWNKYGGNVYVPYEINGLKVSDLRLSISGCKFIKTLTFGEGYTEIPELWNDRIEIINLPKSVQKIPFTIVKHCPALKELNIPKYANVKITFGFDYSSSYYRDVEIPSLGDTKIESLTLPDCWKHIRLSLLPYKTLKELNCAQDACFFNGTIGQAKESRDLLEIINAPLTEKHFKEMADGLVLNGKKLSVQ